MADDCGMMKNFEIVSTGCSFISKEVNFAKIVIFQVTQAKGLVPALWEGVNRNLSTDRVFQAVIGKFSFEGLDEAVSN